MRRKNSKVRGELSSGATSGIHNQCEFKKISFFTLNYLSIKYGLFLEQRFQTGPLQVKFIADMYCLDFIIFKKNIYIYE